MLKKLYDLIRPNLKPSFLGEEKTTDFKRKQQALRKELKERRRSVTFVDLEKELHEHLTKILVELDHVSDVIALTGVKSKDECEHWIFEEKYKSSVIPQFEYYEETRTFSLGWARWVATLHGSGEQTTGKVRSQRLPMKKKDEFGVGIYSKTIFASCGEETKPFLYEAEDNFRDIRELLGNVTKMKSSIRTMDRISTNLFDRAIMFDQEKRVKTSKLSQMPESEPTHVKIK